MAADTREPSSSASSATAKGKSSSTSGQKEYESFHVPASANAMPGGTENTAGGKQEDVTLEKVVKSISLEDFKKVHRQPCVRDSLLLGIGGGFGLGGIRAILGAPIPVASNWAAGAFVGVSFVAYEFCQYRRQLEMQGMKKAIEIIDRKKVEKEEKLALVRETRRKNKEEADKREEEAKKRKSRWSLW